MLYLQIRLSYSPLFRILVENPTYELDFKGWIDNSLIVEL